MEATQTSTGCGARAPAGTPLPPFDFVDAARQDDIYAVYRRYREAGPVHWGRVPGDAAGAPGWWYVFSHETAVEVLRDHARFGSDPKNALPGPHDTEASAFWSMYSKWMKVQDPPVHKALRTHAATLFAGGSIARHAAGIARASGELLDRCAAGQPLELMRQYAYPLALRTISDFMNLGGADQVALSGSLEALCEVFDMTRQADPAAAERAALALQACIAPLAGAGPADPELLAFQASMLFGGYEAPALAIGNCMVPLLRDPALFGALKRGELSCAGFVDEALRLHAPIQAISRFVLRDTELGGRPMRRGQGITVVLGAANRDPRAFGDPDTFLAARGGRQLAFGDGIHFCIGVRLAALMAQAAVSEIVRRFDGLAHRDAAVPWRGCSFRGPARLLVDGVAGTAR